MQYLAISFENSRLKIKSHEDQSDPLYRIGLDFRCMKEQEFQPSVFHSHELWKENFKLNSFSRGALRIN